MRIPPAWRPVRIDDAKHGGVMLLGDGQRALVQMKWLSNLDRKRKYDPLAWVERRIAKTVRKADLRDRPEAGRVLLDKPAANRNDEKSPGFVELAWLPGVRRRGRKAKGRTSLWYGYAAGAGLLLEVTLNTESPDSDKAKLLAQARAALASLAATAPADKTLWSIFETGFESPAGMALQSKRVLVGDVALLFASGRRRLKLRQVYPAGLAIERRKPGGWLNDLSKMFATRRRFRVTQNDEECRGVAGGVEMAAWKRVGRYSTPMTLGRLRRRPCILAAAQDRLLDRLLMVEYEYAGKGIAVAEEAWNVVLQLLVGMNWQKGRE